MSASPDFSHQRDIFNPGMFTWPIHIIGLGGIGSALLLPLINLSDSFEMHLWDDDKVEPHNLPAQLIYRPKDVGQSKVAAATAFAKRQGSRCKIIPHETKVDKSTSLEGIVIAGVDSMKSRKRIWRAVKSQSAFVPLFMDGRIGGEQWELITIDPSLESDCRWYEANKLFDDADAAQLPCAARTVIHPPVTLAGHMVSHLTQYARELESKKCVTCHMRTSQYQTLARER